MVSRGRILHFKHKGGPTRFAVFVSVWVSFEVEGWSDMLFTVTHTHTISLEVADAVCWHKQHKAQIDLAKFCSKVAIDQYNERGNAR